MRHFTIKENLKDCDPKEGFTLSVNKPLNWTSFDLVNKIRYHLKQLWQLKKLKVGHAGTLDPLATGLVVIGVGKGTKTMNRWMGQKKTYTGKIKLGATTASYDRESEEINHLPTADITAEDVERASLEFTGTLMQKPPVFSALKKGGIPMYKMARRGEKVEVHAREVHVEKFEILDFSNPIITFELVCSKGTYVRSLAHDLGQLLGVGGFLYELKREGIGELLNRDSFEIEEALNALSTMSPLQNDLINK